MLILGPTHISATLLTILALAPIPYPEDSSNQMDILWIIDNSSSQCYAQSMLREGADNFIQSLASIDLDFHLAVTTTHMEEDNPNEPIARPGHLQSTPQPLPGFTAACRHPLDKDGDPIQTEFTPILENIITAVGCTTDPEEWEHLLEPEHRDLECAASPGFFDCDLEEILSMNSLFPTPESYREIPLVLKSADYLTEDGSLDVERLAADFACMSLVGTRGYGFEKGLSAVTRAVHPEMTGGPGADPADFPNAGFLREEAKTSVIFITDENDCTHDGTLDETRVYDIDECTIQEQLGHEGALLSVEGLRDEFMKNLALSKGLIDEDVTDATEIRNLMAPGIIAASLHGPHQIFEFDDPANPGAQCTFDFSIPPSCENYYRRARSGHRYAEFVSNFPVFYPDPRRATADPHRDFTLDEIPGNICTELDITMLEISDLFVAEQSGCITALTP